MSIDRPIFKKSFTADSVPSWICPTCNRGVLESEQKNFKIFESSESKSNHTHNAWEPNWDYGAFIGFLQCNSSKCSEIVGIIGKMQVEEGQVFDEENDYSSFVYYKELTPTKFHPALHIFNINKDVPKEITNAILNAFDIFWTDLSACGNKIRSVVECILDDRRVPKTYIDKGNRKGYTLHKRIEIFKKSNPEEADNFMAIKWIGNTGSHQINNLTKDDIMDGLEILEYVTNNLYDKNNPRIKKLSKKINKRKRPLGKKV